MVMMMSRDEDGELMMRFVEVWICGTTMVMVMRMNRR
jgi:hypothetical protein